MCVLRSGVQNAFFVQQCRPNSRQNTFIHHMLAQVGHPKVCVCFHTSTIYYQWECFSHYHPNKNSWFAHIHIFNICATRLVCLFTSESNAWTFNLHIHFLFVSFVSFASCVHVSYIDRIPLAGNRKKVNRSFANNNASRNTVLHIRLRPTAAAAATATQTCWMQRYLSPDGPHLIASMRVPVLLHVQFADARA